MKCHHCGCRVWCQGCGADVITSQGLWHRRRVAYGVCPRCGRKKTKKDGPHVNCFDCRCKHAARMRARYATHGRNDRRKGIAA